MKNLDFSKSEGLIPAVIQDVTTLRVLMVGFMNEEALNKTISEGKVTFFSRSRQKLWTKGETSGNYLYVKEIFQDCDNDSLLIKARPAGPVCHRGTETCFDENGNRGFLYRLEEIIEERIEGNISESYVNKLYRKGTDKVAQKVGEEAVELVIESKNNDSTTFLNEAADLLFHFTILLKTKGHKIEDVEGILKGRHKVNK